MEVRCFVQDPFGRCIPGATVMAKGADGAVVAVEKTDERGWAVLPDAAGAVKLEIFPPRWGESALGVTYPRHTAFRDRLGERVWKPAYSWRRPFPFLLSLTIWMGSG